ncbi:MAG: hypothetical protein EXQ95_13495 [Alphaproteobacteria bacterium]|nr:hypothetical protein [Alphaproteobacteria bacterium]
MTDRLSDTDARLLAARAGVTLDGDRAHNAAAAAAGPLAAADGQSRTLAFEAEPAQFLAIQQRCKP